MVKFNHFDFNVLNLEKSLEFYEKALGPQLVEKMLHWLLCGVFRRRSQRLYSGADLA